MTTNERRQRACAEAAEWWSLLQSDNCSKDDRGHFVDWLRESKIHVAELLRIAQVHGALGQFQQWARISSAEDEGPSVVPFSATERARTFDVVQDRVRLNLEVPPPPAASTRRSTRGWVSVRRWATAASVALAATAAFVTVFNSGQVIRTDRGERREVSLADGSTVNVDPETYLEVRFDQHARRVTLSRGRAYFHVKKDASRPFLVRSRDTVVRAVGTAFGVDQSSPRVIVTVAEGTVAVSQGPPPMSAKAAAARLAAESAPQPMAPLLVTAGQQVSIEPLGTVDPIKHVDSERELAWVAGRLVFDNDTVAAAVAQFNRYNNTQLRILDEALAQRRISAIFNASQPESFVAFLQGVTAIRVLHDDTHEIVLAPAQPEHE